jgi:hypothetical protein
MAITQFPAPNGALTRRDVITSSTTWTHPDGASASNPKPVYVIAVGGGGGGGGGVGSNNGLLQTNVFRGGSGGGAGFVYSAENLVKAPVSITIGAGGTGRAGIQQNDTNWTQYEASSGGATSFGSAIFGNQVNFPIFAFGGGGGITRNLTYSALTQPTGFFNAPGGVGSSVGGEGGIGDNRFFDTNGESNGGFFSVNSGFGPGAGGGGSGFVGSDFSHDDNFVQSVAATFATNGGLGGVSAMGNGGNGGASSFQTAAAAGLVDPLTNGANGTGNGAGGGGGGARSATGTIRGGTGGNGSAGLVIIYY